MFNDYFRVTSCEIGAEHVVFLHGELDLASSDELVELLVETEGPTVTVDLSELTFVDSTGLAALLGARRAVKDRGDEFVFRGLNPSGPIHRVLELTGVLDLFDSDWGSGSGEGEVATLLEGTVLSKGWPDACARVVEHRWQ